jgi:hypothetical protein
MHPIRLSAIDDISRDEHAYLHAGDLCYYIGVYTSRAGFHHSAMNDMVLNLKKGADRKGTPEWKYKELAIQQAAALLRSVLCWSDIPRTAVWVPVPPTHPRGSELYDDRLQRLLREADHDIDVRELVVQIGTRPSLHTKDQDRMRPDTLAAHWRIDHDESMDFGDMIVVFDDVLVNGTSFKAMQSILLPSFRNIPIIGVFLARREIPSSPLPDPH